MKVKIINGTVPKLAAKVNSFAEGKKMFNGIIGGYYYSAIQSYLLPLDLHSLFVLHRNEFEFDKNVKQWYLPLLPKREIRSIKKIKIKGKLFKFQKVGVKHIEANNGNALLADDMGIGKTLQTLAWLQLRKKLRPVLIVCPATLKLNWENEIYKWTNEKSVQILSGKTPYSINAKIVIINYDILFAWLSVLRAYGFKVMVMDEIHMTKSSTTKRTKAVKMLAKSIPHKIGLTGTPIENRPIEMFEMLSIIKPELFINKFAYAKKFCAAYKDRFGWQMNGSSNEAELNYILSKTIMIRRKKSEVLKDLPEKIHSIAVLEIDNETEYKKAEKDIVKYLKETKGEEKAESARGAKTLVSIEVLKQLAVRGKIKQVIEWIATFLASGEKLVVFATHKETIQAILTVFTGAVKIDGSTSIINRQKAVDSFQNDPKVNLIVGNIKAMGVGITLTAASNVAFVELGWTSTTHQQAEDRCLRIGQKFTVNVYYLLAKNTIEVKIMELLKQKANIIEKIVDGKPTYDTSVFNSLLKILSR